MRVPANAELHEYVTDADVLPDCVAVIGHGGHSTTFPALAHGLPLIVIPMHPLLEQPMVGRSVTRAGAGIVLWKKASAPRIASESLIRLGRSRCLLVAPLILLGVRRHRRRR